jgi:hypothetical protein
LIYTFSLNYKLIIATTKHQFMEKWGALFTILKTEKKQKQKQKQHQTVLYSLHPHNQPSFAVKTTSNMAFLHMALLYSINTGSVFICSFFISPPHMTSNKIGSSATHTTLKHNFEHNCIQNHQIHIGPHASNE